MRISTCTSSREAMGAETGCNPVGIAPVVVRIHLHPPEYKSGKSVGSPSGLISPATSVEFRLPPPNKTKEEQVKIIAGTVKVAKPV